MALPKDVWGSCVLWPSLASYLDGPQNFLYTSSCPDFLSPIVHPIKPILVPSKYCPFTNFLKIQCQIMGFRAVTHCSQKNQASFFFFLLGATLWKACEVHVKTMWILLKFSQGVHRVFTWFFTPHFTEMWNTMGKNHVKYLWNGLRVFTWYFTGLGVKYHVKRCETSVTG